MKKFLILLTLIFVLFGSFSCGTDRTVNGKLCETYGLINRDELKCGNVRYCTIIGNVIWGIFFVETVIVPIYFFGFSIQEPCANQATL